MRAVFLRLQSGKENTKSIQTVYPLDVHADIDTPIDEVEVCTTEKNTSTKKRNPILKKNSESRQESGDSGGEMLRIVNGHPTEGLLDLKGPSEGEFFFYF